MLPTPPTAPYDTLDLPLVGTPTAADRLLSGRYRIVRELGRGGMGVVYLAHDEELDMDIAIKFLPVELANDRRALEQLRTEAKLSMSLSHPNIVRLHTLDNSGQFKFLVMEYVDGPSLLDML
jgi:serine/threonine-protein kinase